MMALLLDVGEPEKLVVEKAELRFGAIKFAMPQGHRPSGDLKWGSWIKKRGFQRSSLG